MTCKTGSINPLQDLEMDSQRQTIGMAIARIMRMLLRFSNNIFDFPGNVSSDTIRRQSVVRYAAGILSGEGAQLDILMIG